MSDVPGIDPQMLERLRRGVPLVLAPTGRFRFDGEDVTHGRVESALRDGLDVSEDGDFIVYLGDQWCYLTVQDCPLRVTAVWEKNEGLHIRLDDGRELPLPAKALREQPGSGLWIRVPAARSGRLLPARFTNAASVELSAWIRLEGEDEAPVLQFGGDSVRVETGSP
ncbi:MAG: hypothetical protein ACE37F_28030 [Nannocystaceae bacterium]|nr:hypothetical protein [bacterium]